MEERVSNMEDSTEMEDHHQHRQPKNRADCTVSE
jgi:hypothetical protein